MNSRLRLFCMGITLMLFASLAAAQDAKQEAKHEAQLRTVHGLVTDKSETPVASGVVFLKNTRSNAVRSYISDNEGNYRFSGLDPNTDYEIHAEKDGAKSPTRTISSFDSKKDMIVNLKIDKKKA